MAWYSNKVKNVKKIHSHYCQNYAVAMAFVLLAHLSTKCSW